MDAKCRQDFCRVNPNHHHFIFLIQWVTPTWEQAPGVVMGNASFLEVRSSIGIIFALFYHRFAVWPQSKASAKNDCTILLDLWSICCVAWKATYHDMQPSMRLADGPKPWTTWHNYFLPRT